jgi:hypothetical protein
VAVSPTAAGDSAQSALQDAWDWFVLDRRTGESTVSMSPNLPIGIYWAATAIRLVARPKGRWKRVVVVTGNGALAWWAADELLRGTSPLRRTLGVVTLGGLAASAIRRI